MNSDKKTCPHLGTSFFYNSSPLRTVVIKIMCAPNGALLYLLDCFTTFAMTVVLESLSLRASVAMRGNPVYNVAHGGYWRTIYYLCSKKCAGGAFFIRSIFCVGFVIPDTFFPSTGLRHRGWPCHRTRLHQHHLIQSGGLAMCRRHHHIQ